MKFCYFFLFIFTSSIAFSQTPTNDPSWELLWQDDFNTLDLNRWNVRDNNDNSSEPQVFLKRNVSVNSGNLEMIVKRENYVCPPWADSEWHCERQYLWRLYGSPGFPYFYTSGKVETKNPYYFSFGYMEARIKLPYGNHIWPAFWTYRGTNVFSNEAEIDIVEPTGQQGSGVFGTNVHHVYDDKNTGSVDEAVNFPADISPVNGFSYSDWHTYAIDWTPTKIIWYLDGSPIRTLTNHKIVDPVITILNVSLKREILRLNKFLISSNQSQFPQKMLVDYVKVFQLKNDCETILNVCNYNFSTHDNRVKKEIIIGNGSCVNFINPGDNVYLRAAEGVSINGDFTVPIGAELYVDVNDCYFNEQLIENDGSGLINDLGNPE